MQKLCMVVVLFVILCMGCTSKYWYKPGVTLEQCKKDTAECRHSFSKKYPSGWARYDRYSEEYMGQKGYEVLTFRKLPPTVKRTELFYPPLSLIPIGPGWAGE